MFSPDFYPTPQNVIDIMLEGVSIEGKTILEPSAGKGNIVDYLAKHGAANILGCEKNEDLRSILNKKCNVIENDFLQVQSEQVSHIDLIVMNPPFSADEKHILHAVEIAPPGCTIIALCNLQTLENAYSMGRMRLKQCVSTYGFQQDLGPCFDNAERKTGVKVGLLTMKMPGGNYQQEFEGFFLEEEPEQMQENALMPYNFVRDLVNRYIAAVKVFDEQLDAAVKMNNLTEGFYSSKFAVHVTEEGKPVKRNEFKKDLQKSAWNFIFNKMNMQKFATKGLREDINKFVEQQHHIPFTMKNIYRMLEIVIGTQSQRMDKAILEVFDKLTLHHHDNRYNVEGWKTNSHYLINEKFIMPNMVQTGWGSSSEMRTCYYSNVELIEDMQKALCFITGLDYSKCTTLESFISRTSPKFGQWYSWGFFEIKGFKKGTMHFKFNSVDLWGKFNQHVARLKGYPLFEPKNNKKAA